MERHHVYAGDIYALIVMHDNGCPMADGKGDCNCDPWFMPKICDGPMTVHFTPAPPRANN